MDYSKVLKHALDITVFQLTVISGAWLVLPAYMIYEFGNEIFEGLAVAAGSATSSFEDSSLIKAD